MKRTLTGLLCAGLGCLLLACPSAPSSNGTLTISPSAKTVSAGSGAISLTATGASGKIAWSQSPGLGSLSSTSGNTTTYTPPSVVGVQTDITINATVVGTAENASAVITVTPAPNHTPYDAGVHSSSRLWIPSLYGFVVGYSAQALANPGQLSTSNAIVITLDAGTGTLPFANALAFDAPGNLWVADGNQNNVLMEYVSTAPGGNSFASFPKVIPMPAGGQLSSLAFASNGDLWVVDNFLWAVYHFSSAQLASASVGSPNGTISASVTDAGLYSLQLPTDLAFDSAGNMWVANAPRTGDPNTIMKFNKLPDGGIDQNPSAQVRDTDGGAGFNGLAFDPAGNLWVTCQNWGQVVKISTSGLSGLSTLTPATTLTNPDVSNNASPANLTFDALGNLWVLTMPGSAGMLLRFDNADSLSGTSNAVPAEYNQGPSVGTGRMQFNPPPKGLYGGQ
jgi:sugar lactone lactonase YvrE